VAFGSAQRGKVPQAHNATGLIFNGCVVCRTRDQAEILLRAILAQGLLGSPQSHV
jgi:hypothetical protein